MRYYHTNQKSEVTGPISLDEIESLIRGGQLPPDPLIVAEGASEWRPFSSFRTDQEATPKSVVPMNTHGPRLRPTIIADTVVGVPLKWLGRLLPAMRVSTGLRIFTDIGHTAVLMSLCLGLVASLLFAIQAHAFMLFPLGALLVLFAAVAQHLGERIFSASNAAIKNTQHRLSTYAALHCIDVLLKVVGAAIVVGGIIIAVVMIKAGFYGIGYFQIMALQIAGIVSPILAGAVHYNHIDLSPLAKSFYEVISSKLVLLLVDGPTSILITSASFGLVLFFISALARCPDAVNVTIDPTVASGEDAVGLIGFINKSALKSVSILFCFTACSGTYLLAHSLFRLGTSARLLANPPAFEAGVGLITTISACLVPVFAYLAFLLINLVLELVRAVLVLPRTVAESRTAAPVVHVHKENPL